MRPLRVRFTVRGMMVAVAVVGIVLAVARLSYVASVILVYGVAGSARIRIRLTRVRFTVRRMTVGLALLLVVGAVADLARNHRRVVRFRAAWAYDEQYRGCTWLVGARAREAARERREAARWPEGSSQRGAHVQAAASIASIAAIEASVGESARGMASELRRLARIPK